MHKPGSILLVVLGAVAAMTLAVTGVFDRVALFRIGATYNMQHTQARQLALSGVQHAIATLNGIMSDQENNTQPPATKNASPKAEKRPAVVRIMELINEPHIIKLSQEKNGISGEYQIYITCEEGKININSLYDTIRNTWRDRPLNHEERNELSALLTKNTGVQDGIEAIGSLIKKRGKLLEDVSELISHTLFQPYFTKLYQQYQTVFEPSDQKNNFPSDLFTIMSRSVQVSTFLATPAILQLAQLAWPPKNERKARFDELAKNLKDNKPADEILAKFYGSGYSNIPGVMKKIFTPTFDPHHISVISCGVFGKTRERVFVILERVTQTTQQNKQASVSYQISKLYWL